MPLESTLDVPFAIGENGKALLGVPNDYNSLRVAKDFGVEMALWPAGESELQFRKLQVDSIFRFKSVAHHIELQRPHRSEYGGRNDRMMEFKELYGSLLNELVDSFFE